MVASLPWISRSSRTRTCRAASGAFPKHAWNGCGQADLIVHAERRRAPQHTMGVARVDQGALSFELVQLG
jgi:hypothetical protein